MNSNVSRNAMPNLRGVLRQQLSTRDARSPPGLAALCNMIPQRNDFQRIGSFLCQGKMTFDSRRFRRARRQEEYDRRVATQLHLLTPFLVAEVTPPIVSHTRRSIIRDHSRGYDDLWNQYFSPDCLYSESMFRRLFRMRRSLFFRIQTNIQQAEPYFLQRPNAAGRVGLHCLQKMTAALRMLAYGTPADNMDESFQLAETTAVKSMKMFCKTIVRLYNTQYLREPTDNDVARLLREGEERGFPGMLGSLDCMHWI